MTRAEMLALLREVEWEGNDEYADCPICEGIKPSAHWLESSSGHTTGCKLAAAIAWIERMPSDTDVVCTSRGGFIVYDDTCPAGRSYMTSTVWKNPEDA